ncbi:hypothetical protein ACN27F_19675 [Solwaraspora sp. WMMB335]
MCYQPAPRCGEQSSRQLRHHWPQQITAHLDRGYDSQRTRDLLD